MVGLKPAAILCTTCSIFLAALGAAQAQERFSAANADLDELSGLAISRADPTVLWGHNDSGGGTRLYRVGEHGEDLGEVRIRDPRVLSSDWEDIAAFEDSGGPALLLADTGDNFELRSFLQLYALRDRGRNGVPELLWRLDFRFPDGAHDCEAVAVDGVGRQILLITKRDTPPRLYRLPLPDKPPAGPQTAEFLGELPPFPVPPLGERLKKPLRSLLAFGPTALAISADGATAVALTLSRAYVYRRAAGQDWPELLLQPAAATLAVPDLPQAEAAALSADGTTLVLGSEGRMAPMARLALPPP